MKEQNSQKMYIFNMNYMSKFLFLLNRLQGDIKMLHLKNIFK